MEIHKTIIGLAIATVIVMGTLVPFISSAVVSYDQDGSVLSFGSYGSDELDGWSLSASVTGSAVHITSTMWNGSVDGYTYLLASDSGNIWYDGTICTLIGNVYHTYSSLDVSITGGSLKIGSDSYPISSVYVPSSNGHFGSHFNGSVNDPLMGVGSFAGVTLGANGTMIIGNTSDYIFDRSIFMVDDRKNLEFGPGEVDIPEIDPFLSDIEHETDPEPGPTEPGELVSSGTTGDCTWELDGTVLYVRGTGAMGLYTDASPAPWGTGITSAIIDEGVTTLGQKTFFNCQSLAYLEIPTTVTSIGTYAFYHCNGLTSLDFSQTALTIIRENAFRGMVNLASLILPEGFVELGHDSIYGCSNLRHLYVPETATTIGSQTNYHFIRLDGYDMGNIPTGDLYLGTKQYVMYQTKTVNVDGATYHINYLGAELETAQNAVTVHIPYSVTYNNVSYTVESVAHNAISGNAVRNVVIPQTVESISSTAITAPNIQQILNLSDVDVSSSGHVRTSVPATVVLSEHTAIYSPYHDVIQAVPLLLILGFVIAAVGSIGSRRL